jgi:hypothetical protein
MSSYKKAVAVAVSITAVGILLVIIQYRHIAGRSGTIVIPAGNTYLGPSPTPLPTPNDSVWHTVRGHIYPYTVSVPANLPLTTFPNDPYDMYALAGNNPSSNVLIGVDDLKKNTARSIYINQPKTVYINAWWKQFSGLTAIKSIEPFTNSHGLKGYTVKFLNTANESSNVDVFFEVAAAPEYVIHLSQGVLDPPLFTKIVDSVGWEMKQ